MNWIKVENGMPKSKGEYLLRCIDWTKEEDEQVFHEVGSWDGIDFHLALHSVAGAGFENEMITHWAVIDSL